MTAKEVENYFYNYYKYLKENNLELEFKRLHFLKKEKAVEELQESYKPKINYLMSLLKVDMGGI